MCVCVCVDSPIFLHAYADVDWMGCPGTRVLNDAFSWDSRLCHEII